MVKVYGKTPSDDRHKPINVLIKNRIPVANRSPQLPQRAVNANSGQIVHNIENQNTFDHIMQNNGHNFQEPVIVKSQIPDFKMANGDVPDLDVDNVEDCVTIGDNVDYDDSTGKSHPFVIKDGNQYTGYVIDVLNAMKNISDFNYYLNDANDSTAINRQSDLISHLIQEVWRNNADFGISNITVTKEREKYVDFTDPLLNYSVSALIHKSNVGGIRTFNQLADQTRITYGALRNGHTMKLFDASKDDMVVRRMYALMNSTGVPVDDLREAVFRVRNDRYAFIGDTMTVQTLARGNCDFVVIADNRPAFRQYMAIVLPKGSNHLWIFNSVIKQLIHLRVIQSIADKYWRVVCRKY
ncbi:unnamed protein product [Oppiella nova]|uniref:Ionotropic glutamate receptor C-terminal domain-containing protein n=1 Tax=Oppiella nova TaxID=334625 RepID=A0A7R9LY20_9ACAR|nr:unnamed protein product [Oppiella nova]CAG2168021.1 unnamed protein product [Oppiella nova]